jgi:hypothetical protein
LLTAEQLEHVIQSALGEFYRRRLEQFNDLNIRKIIKGKNPYLFRAIGINAPQKFIDSILSAYLSSSDEGFFGDSFFEAAAIGISTGRKSISDSVDFELEIEGLLRAYAVKSGPKVFNGQSRRKQIQAFEEARRRMQGRPFEAIVGYGYGQRCAPPKGKKNFREVSGQAFWEEISGDPEMYKSIFALLAKKVDEHGEVYKKAYGELVAKLTNEFMSEFATADGQIDWDKLLAFNSGKKPLRQAASRRPRVRRAQQAT